MTFANPGLLLAGLLAIALPILIHILMRRRRTPVSWGAMEWLMQAYRQQRKRMRFEQLLLLALRCLLVALVAIALGKPLLGSRAALDASRPRTLAILLDESAASQALTNLAQLSAASLEASTPDATALDATKQAAFALIDQLDPARGDRVALILMSAPPRPLVVPASADLPEVRRLLSQVSPTDAKADPLAAIDLARATLLEDRDTREGRREGLIALLGEMREGSLDANAPGQTSQAGQATPPSTPAPSSSPLRVLASSPASGSLPNIAITAVQPLQSLVLSGENAPSPSVVASVALRVTLTRYGDAAQQTSRVRSWLVDASNPRTSSTPSVSTAPASGNTGWSEVAWSQGQREATITLTAALPRDPAAVPSSIAPTWTDLIALAQVEADAIRADNTFARPVPAKGSLQVALVGAANAGPTSSPASTDSSIDRFTPRDWLALAISPQQQGLLAGAAPLRVLRLDARDFVGAANDPAGVPGILQGVSAIALTEPQALEASGWRALRAASQSGALVMITPPEAEQAQTWADTMRDALGVPWQVARTSRALPEPVPLDAARASSSATGEDDLLSSLRPELEELTRSVSVSRILSVDSGLAPGHVLLSLRDGSPLLLAFRPDQPTQPGAPANPTSGYVVLWLASPSLAWTDMPAKPLMVPLVQELLRQGVGRSAPRRTGDAGTPASLLTTNLLGPSMREAQDVVLTSPWITPQQAQETISLNSRAASNALRHAGLWQARDAGGAFIPSSTLAINAPTNAGNTTPTSREQVAQWLASAGIAQPTFLDAPGGGTPARQATTAPDPAVQSAVQSLGSSSPNAWRWSFWLLALAGAIALAEALLARWFSHATLRRDQSPETSQSSAASSRTPPSPQGANA